MMVSNRNLLFQRSIFKGYVSLGEGKCVRFQPAKHILRIRQLSPGVDSVNMFKKHVVKAPPSLVLRDFEKDEKIQVGEKTKKKRKIMGGMQMCVFKIIFADVVFQDVCKGESAAAFFFCGVCF